MPAFTEAQYDEETVQLKNAAMRIDVHRKLIGWGWGEIFARTDAGEDNLVAIIEHFGVVDADEFPFGLSMVASDIEMDMEGADDRLRFALELQDVPDFASYEREEPAVTGELTLTLGERDSTLEYELTLVTETDLDIESVRGPWLRVGAESFGADRDDGILPGLDWVIGDEWSSGTDHIGHPDALRVTPHPNKVAIPTMAIGHDDVGIGLSWHVDDNRPQPVYATPNFIDRQDDSVMGLMYPTAADELEENTLRADPPDETTEGTAFTFDATISLSDGGSLDVLTDWVKRNGLPEPGEPRYEWGAVVDWIAEAYDSNLWVEGEGFGDESGTTNVPEFVTRYVNRGEDEELVESLEEKRAWCEQQRATQGEDTPGAFSLGRPLAAILAERERAEEIGEQLLEVQRADGAFTYEPDGRHSPGNRDWVDGTRSLGQPGETELGFCTAAAATLIIAGRETDDERYIKAAEDALEFATQYTRPAGDDWWETPIHGPNLFAAGKSAIAYYLGYEEFGKDVYRSNAVHWLRSLLPFTHLWTPDDHEMRYNTKPCFVSSYLYAADWTTNHVQWEVLSVFETMDQLGIDWADLDPGINWNRYHTGITTAVLRWMVDSRDPASLEHFRYPDKDLEKGEKDALYTDIFNPVDGWYGGALIEPSVIGVNAMILQDRAP